MQRNWRTEYFKNLIKDKTRTKRWRKVLLCLSCVVVFWTVYALILPAITLESKKCNIEEHTHSAECYSESQELICGKEEHVHTAECTSINNDLSDSGEDAGTVPDASGNDANGNEEGKKYFRRTCNTRGISSTGGTRAVRWNGNNRNTWGDRGVCAE